MRNQVVPIKEEIKINAIEEQDTSELLNQIYKSGGIALMMKIDAKTKEADISTAMRREYSK